MHHRWSLKWLFCVPRVLSRGEAARRGAGGGRGRAAASQWLKGIGRAGQRAFQQRRPGGRGCKARGRGRGCRAVARHVGLRLEVRDTKI